MALNKSESLQLTQLIAIISQLAGNTITPISDEYSDTLMDILNRAISGAGSNQIIVTSLDNLPEPVAEVITLDSDTIYIIEGNVDLGVNRLVTNGAALHGTSFQHDGLIYSGTGVMITCLNNNLQMDNLSIVCTDGTFMDFNGTATERIILNQVILLSKNFGDLDSFGVFEYAQGAISCTNQGMTFSGSSVAMTLAVTGFSGLSGSGTYMDFGTSTISICNISTTRGILATGETFISAQASGGNFTLGFKLIESFFDASGGGVILAGGITIYDDTVDFRSNVGIEDTHAHGQAYVADGDEATTTIGVGSGDTGNPILVVGTYTVTVQGRTSTTVGGRMAYTGPNTQAFHSSIIFQIAPTSGSNKIYNLYIAKNGVVDVASRTQVSASAGAPVNGHVQSEIDLAKNQYVELYIENITDTQNAIVQATSMIMTD